MVCLSISMVLDRLQGARFSEVTHEAPKHVDSLSKVDTRDEASTIRSSLRKNL